MYTKYKIVPFCPYHFVNTILSNTILSVYHFVHTILSVPFCPLPFCPVTPLHYSVLCSLDIQVNKHAVVLLHGRERWEMPFTHFFPRKKVFPTIFNASPAMMV